MNKDIVKDIIKAKLDVLDSIAGLLPEAAGERFNCMQHDFMTIISEAANEYLEKKKPDNDNKQVKTVPVE